MINSAHPELPLTQFIGHSPLADRYRPILHELQRFYCDERLRAPGDVDHFVPWSRYAVDLGDNFVLADAAGNGNKADRIAAVDHLARWCERNARRATDLAEAFMRTGVLHDVAATTQITRWAYEQAETAGGLGTRAAQSVDARSCVARSGTAMSPWPHCHFPVLGHRQS